MVSDVPTPSAGVAFERATLSGIKGVRKKPDIHLRCTKSSGVGMPSPMEEGQELPEANAAPQEAVTPEGIVETRNLIKEIQGNVAKAKMRLSRLGREDFE